MDYTATMGQYLSEVQKWLAKVEDLLADYTGCENDIVLSCIEQANMTVKEHLAAQEVKETDMLRLCEELKALEEIVQSVLQQQERNDDSVRDGRHVLPPLSYSYESLEPYINREIMKLHHTVHHKSYVDGLNKAEKMMKQARESNDYELLKHWEREAAFHGSGHYLHCIFWEVMSPKGGGEPRGQLMAQIGKDFGSYRQFKKHFAEAANRVEGVGWAILVWSPRSHKLEILQTERHQILTQWDTIPILVLDVWEHAYYLQYKTEREKYVDNWWNIISWENVEKRFKEAARLKWNPYIR